MVITEEENLKKETFSKIYQRYENFNKHIKTLVDHPRKLQKILEAPHEKFKKELNSFLEFGSQFPSENDLPPKKWIHS